MKKISVIIGLVSLLSIGCNSDKRRYEIVSCPFTVNNNTYIGMRVLDTYTGDVWTYAGIRKDQDSNWIYAGNPVKLNLK
jgi:hypothetical protein